MVRCKSHMCVALMHFVCVSCCRRVADLFQSVQLNVNNPHFLIMQGRVTKVSYVHPQCSDVVNLWDMIVHGTLGPVLAYP